MNCYISTLNIFDDLIMVFGCGLEFKSLGGICNENSNRKFKLGFCKPQSIAVVCLQY